MPRNWGVPAFMNRIYIAGAYTANELGIPVYYSLKDIKENVTR